MKLAPLKSRTPIRKRRGVRRGPWRSVKYRRYIASFPCLICQSREVQCAHFENNGMSSKGPDSKTGPLCLLHHDEADGRRKLPNRKVGRRAFEEYYEVDLKSIASTYFEAWKAEGHQ